MAERAIAGRLSAMTTARQGPAPVEAIDRALQLLTALAEAGPEGASLAELCRDLGMNKSTAYRALTTMRTRGFVNQNSDGDYQLGPVGISMGRHWFSAGSLAEQIHPALVALSRDLGELTHLGVLSGDEVVYVDKVEPDKPIRVWSQVGRAVPAANTALGRALLSHRGLDQHTLDTFLPSGADTPRLHEVIDDAARRGWSSEVHENEPGVACIGVPILGNGRAVAALSVTMLAEELDQLCVRRVIDSILRVVSPLLPAALRLPPQLGAELN